MAIDKITGQFVRKNLTGKRFGILTVIEIHSQRPEGVYRWRCICDCGKEAIVMSSRLKENGGTKSCGCFKYRKGRNQKHGLKKHPLYSVWNGIKQRCLNPNALQYPAYGGRGIKMCDGWKYSVVNFYNDMINGYVKGLHIGRIDNNGDYCKENCRWETPIQNNNNKRTNVYVTHDGRTHTPAEWARQLFAKANTIQARIRRGRNDYEALFGDKPCN